MSSDKFRITTNNQSLRNVNNTFFDMTLSANLTIDESNDASANNDRRSAHNALERQRREYLNTKYQELAKALPSLKTKRRPSKATIVTSSLDFVKSVLKRESKYVAEIKRLHLENEKLRNQVQFSADQTHSSEDVSPPTNRRNSEVQLSPPLTPNSFKQDSHQNQVDQSPEAIHSPPAQLPFNNTFHYAPSPLSTNDDLNNLLYAPIIIYGQSQPYFPASYNSMVTPMPESLYSSSENLSCLSSENCLDPIYMH